MPRRSGDEQIPQDVLDSLAVLDRLADGMAHDTGPRVFLQDSVDDKYALSPAPPIDCENRVALCKAACCRLTLVLSPQDIEEGIVSWDPQRPYFNAQDAAGDCVHLQRPACRCSVYTHRPAACRLFDCRNDRRIWIDFENRIPNPALDTPGWPANVSSTEPQPPNPSTPPSEEEQKDGNTSAREL